ncbi:hypothetical protein ACHAXN_004987 [Cyclotella atomus]
MASMHPRDPRRPDAPDEFGRTRPIQGRFQPPPQPPINQRFEPPALSSLQNYPQSHSDRFEPPHSNQQFHPRFEPPPSQHNNSHHRFEPSNNFTVQNINNDRFEPPPSRVNHPSSDRFEPPNDNNNINQDGSSLTEERPSRHKIHLKREGGTWKHFDRSLNEARRDCSTGTTTAATSHPSDADAYSTDTGAAFDRVSNSYEHDAQSTVSYSNNGYIRERKEEMSNSAFEYGVVGHAEPNQRKESGDDEELFSDDEQQNVPSSHSASTAAVANHPKRQSRWDAGVNNQEGGVGNGNDWSTHQQQQASDPFFLSQVGPEPPKQNQIQQPEFEQPLQPPSQQHPTQQLSLQQTHAIDTHYTQSLHWANPESKSITKRAIQLPTDVHHIDEVEWAGDEPSKADASTHHLPTHTSNLEKAPRPKQKRHEPCFCEPDLDNQTPCCVDTSCALFACQEECPKECPAGPLCQNKRIQRKEWKQLQVFDAGLKGRGLMLAENANKGDFICEYVGVAIKKSYLDSLFARYKSERMLYIMALDGDVYIDARHRGGIARYINHSCEPNCIVHRWKVRGITRNAIFALRDIEMGEELSFDYHWERKRGRACTKCYCGSSKCRGTLEDAKETNELEEELEGHWVQPLNKKPGREIMNRVIKVWSEEDEQYYVADVAQFDAKNGQHELMYRDQMDDGWTDLSERKWMLLDEDGEKYAIARKVREENDGDSLLAPHASHSTGTSPRSDSMSRSCSPVPGTAPGVKTKNYLYIQTPIKDEMSNRHTLFKCGRYCRVHIDVEQLSVSDGTDVDDEELRKAMAESEDRMVWKLVVTGADVQKAVEYLQKMDIIIYNNLHGIENVSTDLRKGGSMANLPDAALAQSTDRETEIIFPRVILEQVRKKFFSLKGYCYNSELEFTYSDSKSKQFAKFVLKAKEEPDLERSLQYLNGELTQMCLEVDAPQTSLGVYKDLGYLGGEMSNEDIRLLFHTKRTLTKWTDCSEDLHGSTFALSFEEANKCSIWIQSEEDMGRVSKNKVIIEANPQKPRKIFFGVAPSRVPMLWTQLLGRIADLKRGVQFLYLGADCIYQPILLQPMKKNGRPGWNYFFDFVHATSGATVRVDSTTHTHLRIDGGDASISEDASREVNERIDIAMEMISLQIELLRDHHIRQQRWGFGRDWALLLTSDVNTLNQIDSSSSTQDLISMNKPAAVVRNLDNRALGSACMEISEIVSSAGLSERVAAHACIIFYRYTSLPSNADALNTNFKLRDAQLASLFIANKSQKVTKWKRLEAVLEHAYKVFYPGSYFNPEGEEAKNWERRVIAAEKTVLRSLNYDVFWPDVDWVINAVVGTNAMAEPIAENTMSLALSGHVLAAGPILWLKYGPKYAFAAIAGYLSLDLEKIFHALSLVPVTVSHAAELIYSSCQAMSKAKKSSYQTSKHEIFNEATIKDRYQKIQSDCASYMDKRTGQIFSDSNFVASPEYKSISHRARLRRVFKGVRSEVVEENIMPLLGKICFESNCNIRFSEGAIDGSHDVILEGNWKALAIAEHLFSLAAGSAPPSCAPAPNSYAAMSNSVNTYIAQDFNIPSEGNDIKQVKIQPGLLSMSSISDKFGWEGTVECSTEYQSSEVYDAGHKTCIAAQASQEDLDAAGLRWWVPHQYGPSLDGSLCEILTSPKIIDKGSVDMRALALLALSFTGGLASLQSTFPTLASFLPPPDEFDGKKESHSIAISLQRWPPEKIELKEQSSSGQMQMGFSVAALQEMQLLHQLHILIPSPKGHPNFILPLAIAMESDEEVNKESGSSLSGAKSSDATEQILAMIVRNQKVAGKKHHAAHGSHLMLEPTPLVLQKVMARYQRKSSAAGSLIPPTILASLCHDILSAISFCHSNHIILRSLLPDQIHIDHCGTAKISGLSKVMVLHGKDRSKEFNPLKFVRDKRKSKDHNTEDVEPFAAPELLLGGNRHTKESDMWAFGALLANLLIGKQLFPGKDRVSKMTQVFKIVGVPTEDNYPDAKRFPFYSNNMYVIGDDNKKKRYPRGVVKALRHMLKPFEGANIDDYSDLISLLDGILHLDPKERLTADEALRHSYMARHSAHVQDQEFRQSYVKDWLQLKENVLTKGNSSTTNKNGGYGDLAKARNGNGGSATKDSKRKAFGDDEDDLYNLDDIIRSSPKRSKNIDI